MSDTAPPAAGADARHTNTPFGRWVAAAAERDVRRFETGIPMRDGLELAADVYLPRSEADPVTPAIVTITPYGKDGAAFSADEASFYRDNGYAFVSVDVRGRGKSEGQWTPFVNDPVDGYDVIEWVAAQPWCNGRVGTTGLSYMGWTQWAAASQRPPHLACMVSTSAAGRWQQEIPFTNGAFQLYFGWWAYATRRRILDERGFASLDWESVLSTLPYDAIAAELDLDVDNWRMLTRHDGLDDLWRSLRFDGRYASIDVPCLHVTGWYDLEDLLGAMHHYENMVADSPASESQYLLVGPWSHVKSRNPDRFYAGEDLGPDAAWDMDAEHLRWFDHWLKDSGSGLDDVAHVRLFERGPNVWRHTEGWPLATTAQSLYLTGDDETGALSADEPAVDGQRSYRYDPTDPVPTGLDVRAYPIEDVPLLQDANEARSDVLSFTGPPLTEPLTVSGWARLTLFASSDCEDTEWHVKICDVRPDGSSHKVTQGELRAAHRNGQGEPSPLVPGAVEQFPIEFWPTHHVFEAGHRIRLTVTSSDFPWFARSLNQFGPVSMQSETRVATNTVVYGPTSASVLHLPVE